MNTSGGNAPFGWPILAGLRSMASGAPRPALFVWIVAGLGGALAGWMSPHDLGYRSEILVYARYLAGIVHYPAGNPTLIALSETATPFHGLVALLLASGLPDITTNQFLKAFNPAFHAQAFALLIFAFSRRVWVALSLALVQTLCVGFLHGADYPINVIDGVALGPIGFGLFLQIFGILACAGTGTALFLVAGLALIHPVFTVAALALIVAHAGLTREWGKLWRLSRGWLAIAASILAWVALRRWVGPVELPPTPPPELARIYFDAWDYHRNVPVDERGLLVVAAVLGLIAMAILRWRGETDHRRRGTLVLIALASAGGLAAWAGFHLLREKLPLLALAAMPNRFLNVGEALAFGVTAATLVSMPSLRRWIWPTLGILIVIMVGSGLNLKNEWIYIQDAKKIEKVALIVTEAALLVVLSFGGRRAEPVTPDRSGAGLPPPRFRRATWGVSACAILASATLTLHREPAHPMLYAMNQIGADGKMVVGIGPINLQTLASPSPELFSMRALDILAYVPALIPAVAEIMRDVYAVDFRHPSAMDRRQGQLNHPNRQVVEARSPEEWRRLSDKYGFTIIYTPPDWKLNLPGLNLIAANIFEIPQ